MDTAEVLALSFMGAIALVLVLAGICMSKDLGNFGGAIIFGGISMFCATILINSVIEFGVQGVNDMRLYWFHAQPFVGWAFTSTLTISAVLPVPCAIRTAWLLRRGLAERRRQLAEKRQQRRAALRLYQLRSSVRKPF